MGNTNKPEKKDNECEVLRKANSAKLNMQVIRLKSKIDTYSPKNALLIKCDLPAFEKLSFEDKRRISVKHSNDIYLKMMAAMEEKRSNPTVTEALEKDATAASAYWDNPETVKNLRSSYYSKLTNLSKKRSGVAYKTFENHNIIFIFDWDDTLMCTSFLTKDGMICLDPMLTEEQALELRNYELIVHQLLSEAIELGDVFIITNAKRGWVEYSASRVLPLVKPLLKDVRIISARSQFSRIYPTEISLWKTSVFDEIQQLYDKRILTNVFSVGDSELEHLGAFEFAKQFKNCVLKNIKFVNKPTLALLLQQLDYLNKNLRNYYMLTENKTVIMQFD